ncbi:MAG: type 1 glutamine amidotransferase [Phaeovulum sp.]|uniref:type 1 glutamine amidotransferase n=1 Tax=Phaeovulum sp. TaxID=2934796 RepID=UPI002730EB9C|nr:type 1 glutamine amidotransferase [Phaeovulum sp.]MDP2062329.1 type 1 glutamine amidotransferase [Phaeovulum sp.]MDP3860224.1 type 1 glutamine amidotransferase [Phaeovulum sp.]
MLIGILQTGQSPDALRAEAGDYPDMFEAALAGRGLEFCRYHVEDGAFPASVRDCEGWLITGSRHGVYEDLPFIPKLEAFLREAYGAGVPIVGICFGHQILAQALGGKVERFEKGWAVGPQDYDFGGEKLTLNAWHRDQVTKVPPGAKVTARNEFCEFAGLAYDNRAFSVQAHPEYPDSFIDGLMRTRGPGVVPEPLMAAARARMGQANSSTAMADRIAAFFLQPRPL